MAAPSSLPPPRHPLPLSLLSPPLHLPAPSQTSRPRRARAASSPTHRRLERLLHAAYHPRNFYLLRHDGTVGPDEQADLVRYVRSEVAFAKFRNIWVVGEADPVTDKGSTMIASILQAVARQLRQAKEWNWFINLSVEDYPLMPQDDILHIFSYSRDLNFIQHTSDIGWREYQRAIPIIVDPGLYGSNKTNVFWAKEKRSMPSSFKLFVGTTMLSLLAFWLMFYVSSALV